MYIGVPYKVDISCELKRTSYHASLIKVLLMRKFCQKSYVGLTKVQTPEEYRQNQS